MFAWIRIRDDGVHLNLLKTPYGVPPPHPLGAALVDPLELALVDPLERALVDV